MNSILNFFYKSTYYYSAYRPNNKGLYLGSSSEQNGFAALLCSD